MKYLNLFSVIEADNPEKVDELSFELPIMKEIGDQVHIEVTPVIPYHSFANFLYGSVGEGKSAKACDASIDPAKEGIFYWLVFNVEYAGKNQCVKISNTFVLNAHD